MSTALTPGEERVRPTASGRSQSKTLEDFDLFDALSSDERRSLLQSSTTHDVRRQHVVFTAGQKLDSLHFLLRGSVKLVHHSEQGKELIVALRKEGDSFGAFVDPIEAIVHAQTLAPSTLVVIPLGAIRRAAERNAKFAHTLLTRSESYHRRTLAAAARLAFQSVPERLGQFLVDSADPTTGEIAYPLNQSEIANVIGSSRETVCSMLNQFRRQGWVAIDRGRVRVLDRDQLLSGVR